MQVASAGRRAPADVIFLTEEAPSFIVAPGYMEPLDGFLAKSPDLNVQDIERLDFWTVDGKVQGVTTYVQLVMMDYNAKRLSAGGFSRPAQTWAELRRQALALKSKGVDPFPISFGVIDWSKNKLTIGTATVALTGDTDTGWTLSVDQNSPVFAFLKKNHVAYDERYIWD